MIIECPACDSKVDGKEKGSIKRNSAEDGIPSAIFLLECPICKRALVGATELVQVSYDDWDWCNPARVWPDPDNSVDFNIPAIARTSLLEARTCFKAKAYTACAVMAGRAVEGVCVHYVPSKKTLAAGLRELKNKGFIDERIFDWGEELRKHRNIGAHANKDRISRDDAKDLLDFALAICDYVFVLNAKFERFKKRAISSAQVKKVVKKKVAKKKVAKKKVAKKKAMKKG